MDFERIRSVPPAQKDGDWPSVAVASDSVFIRSRTSIGASCGSFHTLMSYSASLSCAST